MLKCAVCDVELQPEQKTCHVCGSNVEPATAIDQGSGPASPVPTSLGIAGSANSQNPIPSGGSETRQCSSCGKLFDPTYTDEFCSCGGELRQSVGTSPADNSAAPESAAIPSSEPTPQPVTSPAPEGVGPPGATRPVAGTVCLVLYSDTKPRQPIRYFAINKDVLVIGRQDPVRGDFPDVDLGSLLDASLARKVSRRHAEVLRARDTQTYRLRPLPGNTGTQVGKELASAGEEYQLTDGTPIVLGGAVWMKFETIR